jgi:DNA-binding response OmpR family regulator
MDQTEEQPMSSSQTAPAIVVTDHDAAYLDMIRELLVEQGYPRVLCVAADSAWVTVKRELPMLVLVDISIQHPQEGWALIDMMRLHARTAQIPVIICSTDPRLPGQKADMLAALDCHFLEKPFRFDGLLTLVESIIGVAPDHRPGQSTAQHA